MYKILVIEDEIMVLENLKELLTINGYQVFIADNGRDGIDIALEHRPDLIICDIMMPKMDGYEVLSIAKNNEATVSIPFMFLTAKGGKRDFRKGMELGADDYISKPFNNKDLLIAVKNRLEMHQRIRDIFNKKMEELRFNITSVIPHEMRTPLNSIIGFSEIIKEDIDTFSKADILSMVDSIYNSSHRLNRMIANYTLYLSLISGRLDLDKPDAKKQKPKKYNSMEKVYECSQSVAKRHNRVTNIRHKLDNIIIDIPSDYLYKVVEELVENAMKFSNPSEPVSISTYQEEDMFFISVFNKGRGMTDEQVNSIGAFVQFDRKEQEQQGSGLGLIIVKLLAEKYDGSLEIISNPGKNIEVTVSMKISGNKK